MVTTSRPLLWSQPNRCNREVCPADSGGGTLGNRKVKAASTSHVPAQMYCDITEPSAFSALTSQQPAIHPTVAPARIGPN